MQSYTPLSFIYPKEIQMFTRKSIRQARYLLQKIKTKLGKQKEQCITISEFCDYMSLKVEDVMRMLRS
jgi:hypothetical protein